LVYGIIGSQTSYILDKTPVNGLGENSCFWKYEENHINKW